MAFPISKCYPPVQALRVHTEDEQDDNVRAEPERPQQVAGDCKEEQFVSHFQSQTKSDFIQAQRETEETVAQLKQSQQEELGYHRGKVLRFLADFSLRR